MRPFTKLFLLFLFCIVCASIDAQCPMVFDETTDPDCSASCTVCLGDEITINLSGDNLPEGCIDWFIGPDGTGDLTGETFVGCSTITNDCAGGPQAMYVVIDPPTGSDRCDEMIIIHTGESGFTAEDIEVTNSGNNPLSPYVLGNLAAFTNICTGVNVTAVGPGDFIPDDAILIIQTSAIGTVEYDMDNLCDLGLDIFVLASDNTDCGGGFFVNGADASYTVSLGCDSDIFSYLSGADNWIWDVGGVGGITDVIPELNIPPTNPGLSTIDELSFEITQDILDDFCTPPNAFLDLQGYLNPQVGGSCPDLATQTFNISLACPMAVDIDDIAACITGGSTSIDLTQFNAEIAGGLGTVIWSESQDGSDVISDPQNYSGTGPVYASVELNGCISETVEIEIIVFDEPIIDVFFQPDPACEGDELMLFEDGGDAVSWEWEGPGGFDSEDQNPTNDNATAGTYSVTITDANGCVNMAEIEYDPSPSPVATVDVTDTDLCEGSCIDITFEITAGGSGPYDLEWDFSGLITIPFTATTDNTTWTICTTPGLFPTIDPVNNIAEIPDFLSVFTLELISVSENGCEGTVDADIIEFNIIEPPTANNAGPLEACIESGMSEAIFDLESLEDQIGDGNDVLWFEDIGLNDEITPPYNTDASTTVFAVVFDGDCFSEPVAIQLNVLSVGGAGDDGALSFCEGESSIQDLFGALNGTPDLGGVWTDVDGANVNIDDPSMVDFSLADSGTFDFTYSFDGAAGCPASEATVTVTIDPAPMLFLGEEGCSPDNMFFILNLSTDVAVNIFSDVGSITLISSTEFEISVPTSESEFTLTLTNSATGCMLVETIPVPDCDCGFIEDPMVDEELSICEGEPIPVIDSQVPDNLEVVWLDENGDEITNTGTFQPPGAGTYGVQFIDPSDQSCVSSIIEFVVIIETPANIGNSADLTVCEGHDELVNIIALVGNPDAGGVWTDPMAVIIDATMLTDVDFSGFPVGQFIYNYEIESEACGNQAIQFTINIQASPNAGMSADTLLCSGALDIIDLTNIIAPFDIGGTWTETTNTLDLSNPQAVNLIGLPFGTYTINYTIPAMANCDEQVATINLTLTDRPSAGEDVMFSSCLGQDVDLAPLLIGNSELGFFELIGSPGTPTGTIFETTGFFSGLYEFYHIIPATADCEADTSLLAITLTDIISAGFDNSVEVCPESNIQLSDFILNGEFGGVFTNLSDGSILETGIFDASGLEGQIISFDYEVGGGSCPLDNATITLNVAGAPDFSYDFEFDALCEGECGNLDFNNNASNNLEFLVNVLDESGAAVVSNFIIVDPNSTLTLEVCNQANTPITPENLGPDQNYTYEFEFVGELNCIFQIEEQVEITTRSPEPVDLNPEVCENGFFEIGGQIFDIDNPSGTASVPNANACDSVFNVSLSFLENATGIFDGVVCGMIVITINGTNYSVDNPSGFEVFPGQAANGCDSLLTVDLEFEEVIDLDVIEDLCPGESIELGGIVFDQDNPSGQAIGNSNTEFGCDTTFNVMLNFEPNISIDVLEACPGDQMSRVVFDGPNELLPGMLFIGSDQTFALDEFPFEIELPFGIFEIEFMSAESCLTELIVDQQMISDPVFQITQSSIGDNLFQLSINSDLQIDSISWSNASLLSCNDCINPTTSTIQGEQIFVATAFYGNNCTISSEITLVQAISECIFVPNIFTPDGDGTNDIIFVQTCLPGTVNQFSIYDRWGNLVFNEENYATDDIGISWNGRDESGQRYTQGVFVYFVSVDLSGIGVQTLIGDITIIDQ